MSKKVGNALSAFGIAESTLEKDRPALDNVNRRFEAIAKAKNFGQSSTTGKFDSLQKFLRPSLKDDEEEEDDDEDEEGKDDNGDDRNDRKHPEFDSLQDNKSLCTSAGKIDSLLAKCATGGL
ncbi:hypothetical protein COL922a_001248 [Colletotrichum nupharicola]|nr:hypothetical protein COL922a_001248 [Colletotrichum nupharicola]